MNTHRLLRLADFLDRLPPEKFNIHTWWETDNCGTVGCALGWACTIPEFKEAGLFLQVHVPTYLLNYGYDAASDFFGITPESARRLFFANSYEHEDVSPAEVSFRIRELVSKEAV